MYALKLYIIINVLHVQKDMLLTNYKTNEPQMSTISYSTITFLHSRIPAPLNVASLPRCRRPRRRDPSAVSIFGNDITILSALPNFRVQVSLPLRRLSSRTSTKQANENLLLGVLGSLGPNGRQILDYPHDGYGPREIHFQHHL